MSSGFPEYETFDAIGLANLVRNGSVSPTELLEEAIERIEALNPTLNAVIYKMYDVARQTLEKPLPDGLFKGVPFLLKDLLAAYAGVPLQSGSRYTQGWIPQYDSNVVTRFKKAGLVIMGKTNVPEFGLSPITEPELFGPTRNPWDLTRNSGGSSGGSAAAVAARIVPLAHGNDGGGSLRIPSSYCGVFGLKPSRGRTPVGPVPLRICQGMVVENVITRSVRDCAGILDVISGPELGSPISLPAPNFSFLSQIEKPCRKLKIAVAHESFFPAKIHPDYLQALEKTQTLCKELGHEIVNAKPKINANDVMLAFIIVMASEASATLKFFAQILQKKEDYSELESISAILFELGKHFSGKDYAWANFVLDATSYQFEEFFTQYDVILTPTVASPPPEIGKWHSSRFEKSMLKIVRHFPYGKLLKKLTEQMTANIFELIPYTPIFNITGGPAMSVPLFWDKNGLPIGMQFGTKIGDEATLLQLARQLEQAKPWDKISPPRIKKRVEPSRLETS